MEAGSVGVHSGTLFEVTGKDLFFPARGCSRREKSFETFFCLIGKPVQGEQNQEMEEKLNLNDSLCPGRCGSVSWSVVL